MALTKLFFSKWDWSFESTPTEGTANRPIHLCRGKCLGGSSATNALLYHRGTREDFDSWDLEGWGSEEMLQSFLAVEGQRDLSNAKYHNADGPVGVESARYRNPLSDRFLEAAEQAGHPRNPDFNDWDRPQEGVGQFQLHTRRGKRAHAAATHLRAAMRRPNLHVQTSCTALKVVLDDARRATGVAYVGADGEESIAQVVTKGSRASRARCCSAPVPSRRPTCSCSRASARATSWPSAASLRS